MSDSENVDVESQDNNEDSNEVTWVDVVTEIAGVFVRGLAKTGELESSRDFERRVSSRRERKKQEVLKQAQALLDWREERDRDLFFPKKRKFDRLERMVEDIERGLKDPDSSEVQTALEEAKEAYDNTRSRGLGL
jgi:predicted transcriptional regulator